MSSNSTKYPIGGFAPGNYTCMCSTCWKRFTGDKRAVQCEPCALNEVAASNSTKTLQDFKRELAAEYGREDYRHDFEIGAGLNKLMSEEEFFDRAAEAYATYKAEQAVKEAMYTWDWVEVSKKAKDNKYFGWAWLRLENPLTKRVDIVISRITSSKDYLFCTHYMPVDKPVFPNAPSAINPHKK